MSVPVLAMFFYFDCLSNSSRIASHAWRSSGVVHLGTPVANVSQVPDHHLLNYKRANAGSRSNRLFCLMLDERGLPTSENFISQAMFHQILGHFVDILGAIIPSTYSVCISTMGEKVWGAGYRRQTAEFKLQVCTYTVLYMYMYT